MKNIREVGVDTRQVCKLELRKDLYHDYIRECLCEWYLEVVIQEELDASLCFFPILKKVWIYWTTCCSTPFSGPMSAFRRLFLQVKWRQKEPREKDSPQRFLSMVFTIHIPVYYRWRRWMNGLKGLAMAPGDSFVSGFMLYWYFYISEMFQQPISLYFFMRLRKSGMQRSR